MVDVDAVYGPSKYLKAADLPPRPVTYTIERAEVRTFDSGPKVVVFFRETDKPFILNKINANIVKSLYGRDTDAWVGKQLTLAKRLIQTSDNQQVMSIRVLLPGREQRESRWPGRPANSRVGPHSLTVGGRFPLASIAL